MSDSMKVALYARVSTDEQDLQSQIDSMERYCDYNNLEIYKVYKDIVSGAEDSRPGFNNLLKDMRAGKFNGIVVTKLDRIGRSLKHLLQLFEEFNNKNIDFISTTQNFDTTTAQGRYMLKSMMLMAEFERELISERTKETLNYYKRQLKEKGYYITKDGEKRTSLGRPKGSKDKKDRKKSGYYRRWSGE